MKTVLVTGATSGIGLAICETLVKNNYHVIGIGRSLVKNGSAVERLKMINPEAKIKYFLADLLESKEVERVSEEINKYLEENSNGELYGLINNAGCVRSWFQTNSQGYEHQFALNHLASFLLTHYLLPKVIKARGRIIVTSSNSHKAMKINWNDVMFEKRYRPLMAYKQSKLCNMLFVHSINKRYKKIGVYAYGVDPGLVNTDIGQKNTGGLVNFVWNLRKKKGVNPETPAKTYLWLLKQIKPLEDIYYYKEKPKRYNKQVNNVNAERLFVLSEKYTNIKFGENL